MKARVVHSCLLAMSLLIAAQQGTAQQVTIRHFFSPRDTIRYKTVTKALQKGEYIRDMMSTAEEEASLRVQKVYEDSSADIIMTIEKVEVRILGEKISSDREDLIDVPVLLRRTATGKYLDVKPAEDVSSKVARLIEQMKTSLVIERGFPDRPISVGESWEDEAASSFDWGEMRVEQVLKQTSKLLGFERFRGARCAVVSMKIEASGTVTTTFEEVPVKGSGRGNLFFDLAKGRILQVWIEFQITARVESKKGPMNIQTTYGQKMEILP